MKILKMGFCSPRSMIIYEYRLRLIADDLDIPEGASLLAKLTTEDQTYYCSRFGGRWVPDAALAEYWRSGNEKFTSVHISIV